MTRKVLLLLSLLAALGMSACNTMEGIGKDVERGGESVQDAARSTKEKM